MLILTPKPCSSFICNKKGVLLISLIRKSNSLSRYMYVLKTTYDWESIRKSSSTARWPNTTAGVRDARAPASPSRNKYKNARIIQGEGSCCCRTHMGLFGNVQLLLVYLYFMLYFSSGWFSCQQ